MFKWIPWILFFLIFSEYSFAQEFRFAVWGDSQFQNPETFEETVRRTELLKPDLVIHVGDMIHGYTYNIENARRQWKKFKSQISPLSVPFYPTPGNHDITTKEIQPAYSETWGENKLMYSFDYLNSHFIILNTGVNQKFETLPPEEIEWLKTDLEKSKDKGNIFISMHSPLFLDSKFDWEPLHALLTKYPVKAVFSGHYHAYTYKKVDGIEYFCLNSSGNMDIYNDYAGRFHNFLWATVKGNQVSFALLTKNKIYKPDFITPSFSSSVADVVEPDGTIVINNPCSGIDTSIYILFSNQSSSERTFNVYPVITDYIWRFDPEGYNFSLAPGTNDSVLFRIVYTGKTCNIDSLPALNIESGFVKDEILVPHTYKLKLFTPPVAIAKEITSSIKVDGADDEDAWKLAPGIRELFTDRKHTPAAEKTSVRVLYDKENLYVFVRGDEPHPEGLSKSAYGDIPLVFGDDDFELYFDTNRDLKTFYRLMVNPAGTVLCSGPKGLFSFKFDVKTRTGADQWSAEFKIPFKELGIPGSPRQHTWGFNVRRHRQQADVPQSDWSKMNNLPPYQPEYFGLLKFY